MTMEQGYKSVCRLTYLSVILDDLQLVFRQYLLMVVDMVHS